jgi:hypothetical protein
MSRRDDAPTRDVTDVGRGDYVLVADGWLRIRSNSAFGKTPLPRSWVIVTDDGMAHGMYDIGLYAKAEDMEGERSD